MASNDWFIQIPLSELVALQGLPARIEDLENTIIQLRREVEALRRIQSDSLQILGDLRREFRKR